MSVTIGVRKGQTNENPMTYHHCQKDLPGSADDGSGEQNVVMQPVRQQLWLWDAKLELLCKYKALDKGHPGKHGDVPLLLIVVVPWTARCWPKECSTGMKGSPYSPLLFDTMRMPSCHP